MTVDIYTTQTCPYCVAAKALLISKGITYREHDVNGSQALRALLIEDTGRRTVPQIYMDDTHIGGFTDLEHYFQQQTTH
ncbi:hypothetical protein A9Q99_25860 [Gammaproteobacteria bacterium 45_16_T64]|nr:hypothetical protein A9Q99_25860 [Gammaproteobacteria bacterium 45_16_T64]